MAIVESALNPRAKSNSGATGLWQFMYLTGKEFGLEVTSYIDERQDPLKSTKAACESNSGTWTAGIWYASALADDTAEIAEEIWVAL